MLHFKKSVKFTKEHRYECYTNIKQQAAGNVQY